MSKVDTIKRNLIAKAMMQKGGLATIEELATTFDQTTSALSRDMRNLTAEGMVEVAGKRGHGRLLYRLKGHRHDRPPLAAPQEPGQEEVKAVINLLETALTLWDMPYPRQALIEAAVEKLAVITRKEA